MYNFEKEQQLVENNVYACVTSLINILVDYYEELDEKFDRVDEVNYDKEDEREIFEFHIVSSYLGKCLASHGETVWDLYNGTCLWGRKTSGQAIYLDGVIMEIAKKLG